MPLRISSVTGREYTTQLQLTPAFVGVICLQQPLGSLAAAVYSLLFTCDSCQDYQMLLIAMKARLSHRDVTTLPVQDPAQQAWLLI